MDKFFKITERGSTTRAEIIGGLTTFLPWHTLYL